MRTCEALSDRMPAVASGHAAWTDEEASHLATCDGCRAEWELVGAAQALGRDLTPGLAPDIMTSAVLSRVREARRHDARRRSTIRALRWGGLAAAAAVMLAVLFRRPEAVTRDMAANPVSAPAAAVAFQLPLPELEDAEPEELQAVLDGLEAPLGESSTLDGTLGDDVTGQDMERVLRAWEG